MFKRLAFGLIAVLTAIGIGPAAANDLVMKLVGADEMPLKRDSISAFKFEVSGGSTKLLVQLKNGRTMNLPFATIQSIKFPTGGSSGVQIGVKVLGADELLIDSATVTSLEFRTKGRNQFVDLVRTSGSALKMRAATIELIRFNIAKGQQALAEPKLGKDIFREMRQAKPGDVITIPPGLYLLPAKARLRNSGEPGNPIVVRAEVPGTVRLHGKGYWFLNLIGTHWVFENLDFYGGPTAMAHAFHITGDADNIVIRNNRFRNFEAAIKSNGMRDERGVTNFPDDVIIESNDFYNERALQTSSPVTPIDVVGGKRWIIRDNFFADFGKVGGNRVSYGLFLKGNSRDGIMERNLVMCQWRNTGGTRIGMSFGGGGSGLYSKICEEGSCKTNHTNGIMRNNIIMNCSDVGIYLNRAARSKIYNNLLFQTRGIDAMFPTTTADIRNNVLDNGVRERKGGQRTLGKNIAGGVGVSFVDGLFSTDLSTIYADPARHDFTLRKPDIVVQQGEPLEDVTDDFCGTKRDVGTNDLGPLKYGGTLCSVEERINRWEKLYGKNFKNPQ